MFEAVQARLAAQAVERQKARAQSSAILSGLIFDDRGHAMSPSHANKKGVRYHYNVSQTVLQGHKANAGPVPRVSGPDVERLICDALQREAGTTADATEGATDAILTAPSSARAWSGSSSARSTSMWRCGVLGGHKEI